MNFRHSIYQEMQINLDLESTMLLTEATDESLCLTNASTQIPIFGQRLFKKGSGMAEP